MKEERRKRGVGKRRVSDPFFLSVSPLSPLSPVSASPSCLPFHSLTSSSDDNDGHQFKRGNEGLVVGGDEVKTWQGEGSSRGGREKGGGAPIDVEVTRKTIFDPQCSEVQLTDRPSNETISPMSNRVGRKMSKWVRGLTPLRCRD